MQPILCSSLRTARVSWIAVAILVGGCGQDESVVTYTVPKMPASTAASRQETIRWSLPQGWKQVGAKEASRYATIAIDGQPPLELSISSLPPQDLLANVNRWEGQVGASPTERQRLDQVVRHLDTGSARVAIVDVAGPGGRILAGLLDHAGSTWSFKLMGNPDAVAAQEKAFEAFLRSVRF